MTTNKTYAEMVAEAESAVTAVKDPELRRVAFEKILSALIEGKSPTQQSSGNKSKPASVAPKAKAAPNNRGPKGKIEELIDEGFFAKQRAISDVKAELANRGHHIPRTSLSGPLQMLTRQKKLRRQKISGEGKNTFGYSNW